MTQVAWQIPPSVLAHLDRAPRDRPIVLLLRHSVRGPLPPGRAGYTTPITVDGQRIALELGVQLRGRLRTLHTSPLTRCVQTAECLREGSGSELPIVPDRLLGDPGVFVIDGRRAWTHWEGLGHEGVMDHLVTQTEALSGMARPDEAARFLVHHMLAAAKGAPGVHVFVTHDALVTAAAARLLGRRIGKEEWPWFLEGAFFWSTDNGVQVAYRSDERCCEVRPLCSLREHDVLELARREIASTVGLDSGARFFLAGGAFKSLLTGRAPRDLDIWAPSAEDRQLVDQALLERGAKLLETRTFADAFEVAGRVVELPHEVEPATLGERLERFDIGLSAVGVEHRLDGSWSVLVHPLAEESVRRQEVLLLKPLVNWKYALATLERTRRYARELGFIVPSEEEEEVWRVFERQPSGMRAGMVERFRRTALGGFGVAEEVACRFP